MAAVWYRQPDAGGYGVDAVRGSAVQDEEAEIRLGGAGANRVVADLYLDGGLAKSVQPGCKSRLPGYR
ncbi:hypothetical protein D3C75_1209120 [compost metagenome]